MADVPLSIEIQETEIALCVKGRMEGRQVQSWSIVEEYTTLSPSVAFSSILNSRDLLKTFV